MNKSEADKLAEDTLNSIDGIKSITPDEIMFSRIMNSVKNNENSYIKEKNSAGIYALALAIIVLMNLITIIGYQNKENKSNPADTMDYSKSVNEFGKDFFSIENDYNYDRK